MSTAMMLRVPRRKKRAFTLIELLLVLVIIGVLAAIVIPNLAGRGQKAKIDAAKASLTSIQSALKMFEVENSRFPTTEEGIDLLTTQPPDSPLLEKKHLRDPWDSPWNYKLVSATKFEIYSNGPDGRPGTDDDIYP